MHIISCLDHRHTDGFVKWNESNRRILLVRRKSLTLPCQYEGTRFITMDEVIQFIQQNIIGKTLFTDEVIYTLENETLEGVYSDKMMFSDLVKTEHGFKFNMTTVTQELVYNLDGKGERTTLAKDYTGTSVFHYELAMRKSTNQLTGYMRCVSTTVRHQTMEAVVCGIFDVFFDGKELKWQENQLLYRDNPIGEDKYRPVAFHSKVRIYLDNGKAVFEYLPTLWDVNPVTLGKRLSKDDYPPYISREK